MRQIVLQEPGRFIARQVPLPVVRSGEALVHIRRIGVCGSDFHAFAGAHPAYTFPRVVGHEISCEVVEVPENERGIQVGDRCAIEPYLSCGGCRACLLNRPNCCETLRLFGIHIDGGMQEFLTVPIDLLHRSDLLTLEQLALIETLGIGAHAVQRATLSEGDEALIIGAGPIGLAVTQFALSARARVRVVEKNQVRRQFVAQLGVEVLADLDGRLSDVVFDATGSALSMARSLECVGAGGRLVFVGLCRDAISIDDPLLHKREITLYASRNSCHQFPRIIRLIEQGSIDTTLWITDRLPLAAVPEQFATLWQRPNLIKAMIEVEEPEG